jgi:hypothetical protein
MFQRSSLLSAIDYLILRWVKKHHRASYEELLRVLESTYGQISIYEMATLIDGMMSEVLPSEIEGSSSANHEY